MFSNMYCEIIRIIVFARLSPCPPREKQQSQEEYESLQKAECDKWIQAIESQIKVNRVIKKMLPPNAV